MIDFQKYSPHPSEAPLGEHVRDAVESGAEVREKVRRATLRALAGHPLELRAIHAALRDAIRGAAHAERAERIPLRSAIAEAVAGFDDALTSAAHAMRLAGEEAGRAASEVRLEELRGLVGDLRALEALFVEALDGTARAIGGDAGGILSRLAGHARIHGTRVGRAAVKAVEDLESPLREAAGRELRDGARTARGTGAALASVASGILAGVADSFTRTGTPPSADPR